MDHATAAALLVGLRHVLRVAGGPIVLGGGLTIALAAALQLLARS